MKNEVIAKFLNWEIWELYDNLNCYKIPSNFLPEDQICKDFIVIYPNEMKFNISWDWIFPVLEKIRSCGCIIEISMCFQTECRICIVGGKQEKTINIYSELNGIEGVYDCVIQFINYYNEKQN